MLTDADSKQAKMFRGSLAEWKLDVEHALATDSRLQASDVRVAVVMMRFINAGTLTLFPSQELLAKRACMSLNNVVACLKRLKAAGWICWDRGNRQLANVYSFDRDTVADHLARVKDEERQHTANRKRRKPTPGPQPTGGQKPVADHQPTVVRDPQPAGTQHFYGNETDTSELEDVA